MTKIKYNKKLVSVKELSDDELFKAFSQTRALSSKSIRADKILSEMKKRGKGSITNFLKR